MIAEPNQTIPRILLTCLDLTILLKILFYGSNTHITFVLAIKCSPIRMKVWIPIQDKKKFDSYNNH